MKKLLLIATVAAAALAPTALVVAHCEVPCGIYDDDARIKSMFEDESTISKAIAQINELSDTHDPTGHNQLGRWISTKESHATSIQHTIAQYFMTQRIKADSEGYVERLTKAHAVMVAAMKCKQGADPATAEALHEAIHAFEKAYGG